jgi:ferredoxin-NADP reductase
MSSIASQTTYLLKLQNRCEVAERTMAFQFEKPEGFTFKAGQFIDMTLINPSQTDAEGNGRAFSIASAPDEGSLLVATRMRDTAFKRELASMPIGSHVKVEGPFGNLVLHNDRTRAAVFLAGGIGITPFRSILLQIIHERLQYSVFCFFANRRPEDAPFLAELEAMQERYLQRPYWITIVPTMSHMNQSAHSWDGETGRIDPSMLARHLKSAASPIYYLAGPPEMVKGLHTMLNEAGVGDDDIRTEEFSGY